MLCEIVSACWPLEAMVVDMSSAWSGMGLDWTGLDWTALQGMVCCFGHGRVGCQGFAWQTQEPFQRPQRASEHGSRGVNAIVDWLIETGKNSLLANFCWGVEQVCQLFANTWYCWCVHECGHTHQTQIGSGDEIYFLPSDQGSGIHSIYGIFEQVKTV